jgi:hypothetical protein
MITSFSTSSYGRPPPHFGCIKEFLKKNPWMLDYTTNQGEKEHGISYCTNINNSKVKNK